MYFNWSKTAFPTTELKVELQRKEKHEVQRTATHKKKLERIRTDLKRLTVHVQKSLWFAVAPRQLWKS